MKKIERRAVLCLVLAGLLLGAVLWGPLLGEGGAGQPLVLALGQGGAGVVLLALCAAGAVSARIFLSNNEKKNGQEQEEKTQESEDKEERK